MIDFNGKKIRHVDFNEKKLDGKKLNMIVIDCS